MKQNNKLLSMVIAALLCAIGIVIPMYAPKIVLEPASFTLASHVPVFIAMFISPFVAISVALITSIGFMLSGFPVIVVLRALSHIVFAAVGSYVLKKNGKLLLTAKNTAIFGFLISVLHALCEVVVVTFFYFGSNMTTAWYDKGYLISVIGLVGIGTLIHSMIDLGIAIFVWSPLQNIITLPASARVMKRS
jgi:niacin transporter